MGILICGLNGAGKSTLGRVLADRLQWRFIDNEDLFHRKDDPNYMYANPRSRDEVIQLLNEMIAADPNFVFTAVTGDYGEALMSALQLVVCVDATRELRLQRVYDRSYTKFGDKIKPGGALYESESAFFEHVRQRPEDYVTNWLNGVSCPIIHVDGTRAPKENADYIASTLKI